MVKDGHIFADWELEKLNDLVEYNKTNRIMKESSEKGLEKGMRKGIKQGIKKGIEQGIQQGIEQGIQQGIEQGIEQKTNETIINMLKENLSIELISRITEKTEDEILKIKNTLK